MAAPRFLAVPAVAKHTATVIFVHGLGDTGHGWKPVADMLRLDIPHAKFILPHAPIKPVAANMNAEMPSWFNIYSFGLDKAPEDESGMLESSQSLSQLIAAEIEAGIPENRIVLGGFSQGGAMTLLTGLRSERKLAGLVVLSGWLPLQDKFAKLGSPEASSTPIFWGHGDADPLVKLQFANDSVEWLSKNMGFALTKNSIKYQKGIAYNIYEGVEHSANEKELDDLKAWLMQALPKD